jgi:hypothetical protein
MFWMSQWMTKKQGERFLQALLETKAQVDEVSDRQVQRVLFMMRWKRAIAPYVYIVKLTWETVRGRYRIAYQKVCGSADEAPSGSPGAGGIPVAKFTGYGAGFAGPVTTASPNPGGIVNLGSSLPPHANNFEDAGIVAGEVIGYRCWRLKPDGLLYSAYRDDFCWKPGEVAEGDASGGDGVHAFKSIILMAHYAGVPDGYVTGTVDLWGEVYEHERGYRASKAAIRSIDESSYYDAKALRKLYGLNKRKKKHLPKPEA